MQSFFSVLKRFPKMNSILGEEEDDDSRNHIKEELFLLLNFFFFTLSASISQHPCQFLTAS